MRVPRLTRSTAVVLTGILVALALALGYLLLRSQQTTTVLVASRDLAAGQTLTASDFVAAQVRLALPAAGYLSEVPDQAQLGHPLRAGELLNKGDLGSNLDVQTRVLALTPNQPLAANVHVGSFVSIWFIPKQPSTLDSKQTVVAGQIASGLQVLAIDTSNNSLGETKVWLEVAVEQSALPNILAAVSLDGNLSVIADS